MLASLTFLTPAAGLVAVLVVLPLGALAVAAARVGRVRDALGLRSAAGGVDRRTAVAAASVVLLLALAAAQPALTRGPKQRVRTDAEALFVIDISQSMAASSGASGPTRLQRATQEAERLRAQLRDVPSGIATLTDRVLPNLLPVTDTNAFDATLRRTIAIEDPAPFETTVRATDFAALANVPEAGFFDPSARRRVVVFLTDGETRPYDSAAVSKTFGAAAARCARRRSRVARERIDLPVGDSHGSELPARSVERRAARGPRRRDGRARVPGRRGRGDRRRGARRARDRPDEGGRPRAARRPARAVRRAGRAAPAPPAVQSASRARSTPSTGTASVSAKLIQPTTTSLRYDAREPARISTRDARPEHEVVHVRHRDEADGERNLHEQDPVEPRAAVPLARRERNTCHAEDEQRAVPDRAPALSEQLHRARP